MPYPASSATSLVPHYLLPGRPVDQDLLDHLDQMIALGVGFCVLDYTGTLTRQICQRLPNKRAKDCCLVDIENPDRVFCANLLQPSETLDPASQAETTVRVLQTVLEGDLTIAERALLQQSCYALLLAADISKNTGWFAQTYCLLKLWGSVGFRTYLDQFLWDPELRRFWQAFDPAQNRKTITNLSQKLRFLFEEPNRLLMLEGKSPIDFTRLSEGKYVFIKMPRLCQSQHTSLIRWQRYVSTVFLQRYYASFSNDELAEAQLFISATDTLDAEIQPLPGTEFNPHMEWILTKYAATKFGRKKLFVARELGCNLHSEAVVELAELLGEDFQMPTNAYTKDIPCQ